MQVFLSIWAAVGPLIGVLLGAHLAAQAQKRHWILDSMKEEYRELLSTLSQTFNFLREYHAPMVGHGPEEQRAEHAEQLMALAVIGDRVFISGEVKRIDVLNRWRRAVHQLENHLNSATFAKSVGEILADITESAKKIVE